MDLAQIEQSLQLIRSRHDPTRGRQLIFWYDPAGEFAESFAELVPPEGMQKLTLAGTPFAVKYKLLVENPDISYLLYAPFAEPLALDNWLLDLQKQAILYSADRGTLLFQQYRLEQRSLQGYFKAHLSFFNAKKRSEALSAIGLATDCSEMDLRIAMMSSLAGLKAADAGQLIREVLKQGLAEEDNALWQELAKYFAPDEFWQVVEHQLGTQACSSSLRELFMRLALTHLQHDLGTALPDNLRAKALEPSTKAYVFVNSWLRHTVDAPLWAELSRQLAPDLQINELAHSLHPGSYSKVETFDAFDQALIRAAVETLTSDNPDLAGLQRWLKDRKPLFWYQEYFSHYQALEAAADFLDLLQRHPGPYPGGVETLFANYANTYHRIDGAYRRYITASDRATADALKLLTERVEKAYTFNYLELLGEAWSKALEGLAGRWSVAAKKQWWFYEHHAATVLDRSDREKVFVLISDALRYEVAAELQESLVTELRGEATLTPMVSVLPSITKLGMAALLPHKSLSVTENGEVLADGLSTQGLEARLGVLNAAGVSSLAIKASQLLAMSRDEGRQAVQPHRVVYIYQDHIDAVGDKPASEREVFVACERAIAELNALVRKIANQLNGTNILITSDHGFLYQRQALAHHDKVDRASGQVIDSGRRHALGRGLSQPVGTQTFALPYLEGEDLQAQSPRGTLRYSLPGAGAQYVHGGASLQEVCVPLLTYKHVRASKGDDGPSRKVGVSVSTPTRKVTNNHFTLRLVQAEPVSARVRSRQILVKFVDEEGRAVTNSYPLNLESAATQARDREYIARLTVAQNNLDQDEPYYLVIIDSEDELEILRERWQINLAFTDDFGDF